MFQQYTNLSIYFVLKQCGVRMNKWLSLTWEGLALSRYPKTGYGVDFVVNSDDVYLFNSVWLFVYKYIYIYISNYKKVGVLPRRIVI